MLPQELVDLVLGCLDDRQDISQCSLVCREWIYPAQRHLFHSIFLSEERVNRIEDSKLGEMLSQGSYLVAFVQELTLMRCYAHTVPVVDLGTLIWAISSLPNLQSLHLCGVNLKPPQIQRELYLPSCGPTMRLDLLKLSDVTVVVTQDSPHACSFLGLVGSFHSIRRLEIVNLFISSISQPVPKQVFLPKIYSIQGTFLPVGSVLRALQAGIDRDSLEYIGFRLKSNADIPGIIDCLYTFTQLRSLSFSITQFQHSKGTCWFSLTRSWR